MASGPQSSSYWNILTGALGLAVGAVLAALYFKSPTAAATGASDKPNLFVSLVKDTFGYLPHILLLFGVIADAITQDGVYSIASLIGLFSIFGNWLMGFFWNAIGDVTSSLAELVTEPKGFVPPGGIPASAIARMEKQRAAMAGGGKKGDFSGNYDGCDVQGLDGWRSKYAPQTLVVTATIFSYYIFDLISNRGWSRGGVPFAVFAGLFIAQIMLIGDCGVEELGRWAKAAVALVEGIFFGGTSYAIVQAYRPKWLPSSAIPALPRKTSSDLNPGPNGTMVDSSGNPYVCLPNGQCLPDLSSEEARKSFADMAAENLGTGSPALPADCSASSRSGGASNMPRT